MQNHKYVKNTNIIACLDNFFTLALMWYRLFASKFSALGNVYLVVENANFSDTIVTYQEKSLLLPSTERIKKLCTLQNSDGVLWGPIITNTKTINNNGTGSDANGSKIHTARKRYNLIIYNADGSIAEKSGNGLRIFAQYIRKQYFNSDCSMELVTLGIVQQTLQPLATVVSYTQNSAAVSLNLNKATVQDSYQQKSVRSHFLQNNLNYTPILRNDIQKNENKEKLQHLNLYYAQNDKYPHALYDGKTKFADLIFVDIGNPHCVCLVENLINRQQATNWIKMIGPYLESHHSFPQRTNVQLAQVKDRRKIEVYIWERGSGHTLSSGTSAAAVFVACRKRSLVEKNITAQMLGGELKIRIDANENIHIQGSVKECYYHREILMR